mgnify:CR=1 FL=1|jgi:hypothetical protein
MIEQSFADYFEIQGVYYIEYQGTKEPTPKALFIIMRKK